MNKIDKILLSVALFLVAFIISMIVIFCVYESTPDVLIQCVLGAGIAEAVITWRIKHSNDKQKEEDVNG